MGKIVFFVSFIGLIIGSFKITCAQEVNLKAVQVDRQRKRIVIPYSLRDRGEQINQYSIKVFYSQDAGKTYQGPLKYIQGHVGDNILAGENKTIIWHFLKENPNFYGTNVRFKLWATYKPSVLNLGGSEQALYSLMIPGLGNKRTRFLKKRWHWLYVTIPTYALIGTSILFRQKSDNTYDRYLQATNSGQANRLFFQANSQNRVSFSTGIAGLSLWMLDIVQVFIKGVKNQKRKRNLIERNNQALKEISTR